MPEVTIESLREEGNRVVDFGPRLAFPFLCSAYTVEKLSLWHRTTDSVFETVALRASGMPRARVEGNLYRLTDDELKQLDTKRQVGVSFDRKRVLVYVPIVDHKGEMRTIYAYIYLGINGAWLSQIYPHQTILKSQYKLPDNTFSLATRYPDKNRLLNNRFSFLPPLMEAGRIVCDSEAVRKHCKRRNRAAMRAMFFNNIRAKFSNFVNDSDF